jgi:nicotinate-nucleotide--dimethylbenzimidazole phosphoribosyltransferase
MDGYSVNEAATVLGIPEGRVWELLARGVLSGATEVGGDMRVFLRGTALTEAASSTNGGPTRGEGGNGDVSAEITAFRELLTELRNLTERYGQALLALGEARGEVVSLRGRVDLLEARLENRAPWPTPSPDTTWQSAPAPEFRAAAEPESISAESPAWPDVKSDQESEPEPEPEAMLEPEPVAAEVVSAAEVEAAIETEAAQVAEPVETSEPVPGPEPEPEPEPEALTEPTPVAAEVVSAAEVEAAIDSEAVQEAEPIPDADFLADIEALEADIADVADLTDLPDFPAEAAIASPSEPADGESSVEPEPHRSNHGRARAAIAGFAAALARAEDPTTAEVGSGEEPLPGTDELADAVAAYRRDVESDTDERGSASPLDEAVEEPEVAEAPAFEAPAIEAPVPVVRPGYSTETPEPDWIAEEDLIVGAGSLATPAHDWRREAVVADAPEPMADQTEAAPEASEPVAEESEPIAVQSEPMDDEPPLVAESTLAPADTDQEAEDVAAETAASEIAAAFDPWPVRDEEEAEEPAPAEEAASTVIVDADQETAAPTIPEERESHEEAATEMAGAEIAAAFDPWPLHEDDEESAGTSPLGAAQEPVTTDRDESEAGDDVAEPTAYAEIPIESDEAHDAWGLAAAGFTPAPETGPAGDVAEAPEDAPDELNEAHNTDEDDPAPPPWGRVPVEIAAEPPAEDDAPLLRAPEPVAAFAEPPILPQEPAFWEPGARARAPFATPQAEPWESAQTEAAPIETIPPAAAPGPVSSSPTPSVKPSASAPTPSPTPSKPRPPVARRKRGPAARALRRLRYLID